MRGKSKMIKSIKNKLADWLIHLGLRLSTGDRWVCVNSTNPEQIQAIKTALRIYMKGDQ